MAIKRHNSLKIPYPLEGLPSDWRGRVERVIQNASKAFDLYVTNVKAGATKTPEGILISISRDGAEEAWNLRVERTISDRIVDEMNLSREEQRSKESDRLRFEYLGVSGAAAGRVGSVEHNESRSPEEQKQLGLRRKVLVPDLKLAFAAADLAEETRAFVAVALQQMQYPERWALWVRLLLTVEETERLVPIPLQKRLMDLL